MASINTEKTPNISLSSVPHNYWQLSQLANKSALVIYPASSDYQDEHFQIWQVIAVLNTIRVHFSQVDGPSTEFL